MFVAVFSGYRTPVSCSKIMTGISVEGISVGVQQWGPHPLREARRVSSPCPKRQSTAYSSPYASLMAKAELALYGFISLFFSADLESFLHVAAAHGIVSPVGFPEPSPRAWPEGVILLPPSSTQQPRLGQGTRGAGALLLLLEGTMRDFSLSRALGSPIGSFLHFIFPLFP